MTKRYLSDSEIKQQLLVLLLELDRFCKVHDIKYQLAYGTLLGAIRHKGFIPWDDDVDVVMSRPEYEKLRACREDFRNDFYLETPSDEGAVFSFAKLCNRKIAAIEPAVQGVSEESIWLDIFPVDGFPDNAAMLKKLNEKQVRFYHLTRMNMNPSATVSRFKSNLKRVYQCVFDQNKQLSKLAQKMDDCARSFSYESSSKVAVLLFPPLRPELAWDKAWLEDSVEVEFQGHQFPAPRDWDQVLSKQYGDYMQLPPVEDRNTHGTIMFWR